MSRIAIGRHINNITINPMEYILEDNNIEVKLFDTIAQACHYLAANMIPIGGDGRYPSKEEFEQDFGIYFVNEEDV